MNKYQFCKNSIYYFIKIVIPYDTIFCYSIADNMDYVLKTKQKRLIMRVM